MEGSLSKEYIPVFVPFKVDALKLAYPLPKDF